MGEAGWWRSLRRLPFRLVPPTSAKTRVLRTHVVRPGDCIETIAEEHGCAPDALWAHARNAGLRRSRPNPNVLAPGDVVHVPAELLSDGVALRPGAVNVLRGTPAMTTLKVCLQRRGVEGLEPIAGVPFLVLSGRTKVSGTTTSGGQVEAQVPVAERFARVVLHPSTPDEIVLEVKVGYLDPHDLRSGMVQRLGNLGYLDALRSPEAVAAGHERFQHDHGLELTAAFDEATSARLRREHDGDS